MKRAKILMPVMIISLIAFLNGCYPDKIDYVDGFLLERIPGKGIRFRLSEGESPHAWNAGKVHQQHPPYGKDIVLHARRYG